MNTDRELLELAWKAAGYEGKLDFDYTEREGFPQFYWGPRKPMPLGVIMAAMWTYWNPLSDDGDALRLAVQLDIEIGRGLYNSWWAKHWASSKIFTESSERHDGQQDPCTAVRRAVVRAAAEIGRAMS